jgi:hypothetical protein
VIPIRPEVKATTMGVAGFSRKRNIGNDPRRWWRLGVVNVPSGSAAIRPSIEPNIPAVPLSISKIKKQTKYYYYYYKAQDNKNTNNNNNNKRCPCFYFMAFNATTVRYIRHQLEHSDKKNHCIFD